MPDIQPERPPMTAADLRFFEPQEDYAVSWKRLPHWSQAGCVVFVTWRTLDSIPAPVMRRFERERDEILAAHGIGPETDWKYEVSKLPEVTAATCNRAFPRLGLFARRGSELCRVLLRVS